MTSSTRPRAREFYLVLTAFAVVFAACGFASPAVAKGKSQPNNRYASIVMDADTGAILSESNSNKKLHPASLTKVMTLLMLFEAMDNGQISLRDQIRVSKHAASMVPSKLDLPAGSTIKVQDAIYAMVTKSANDVAVAVAERLGGTESGFARMMTRRARELGMNNTTFVNASGLHNPQQVSSARDMAILARTVINQHSGYYRYFSTANFTYKGRSYHNHNRLMETYKGMDGMKTGYVGPSGFNLVASAVRNDRRLIGVVFGGRTTASRNAHMAELLDSGFGKKPDLLIAKNDKTAPRPVYNAPAGNSGITVAALDPKTAPPVPPRKPAILTALNTIRQAAPTSGQVKLASFAPMIDASRYGELAGEGDIDPAEARRIETGLVAASAIRGSEMNAPMTSPQNDNARLLTAPAADDKWSVQIGAFSSRAASDRAIGEAARKIPASLGGSPAIAPLKVKDGWVFRARLGGYSREQAFRACKYVQECMPVAPQNN